MENMSIRLEARRRAVPLRVLAEALGISQATLYRQLAKKMTKAERQRYLDAIRAASKQQATT